MVLLESSPRQVADEAVVGVGTPLPHLQDCVYLGKQAAASDDGLQLYVSPHQQGL
jgi:hypothetical protein